MKQTILLLIVALITSCSGPTRKKEAKELSVSTKEISEKVKEVIQTPQTEEVIMDSEKSEFKEVEEEEDCIFNNDVRGLTVEAISNFDPTLHFQWDEEKELAKILNGKDTVELSIGGCYHFGYIGSYISAEKDIQDSIFWFNKARWISNSLWGPVGKEFSTKLSAGGLEKIEDQDVIYYEFPPDTALTNQTYSGLELEKRKNLVKMTIAAYYN